MATRATRREPVVQTCRAANVVALRQRILPHHRALLARWLHAGERMGLCDVHVSGPDGPERPHDHVLVWVRENADPAYLIEPEGMHWVVSDMLRHSVLARVAGFSDALNFIRPVLSTKEAAA